MTNGSKIVPTENPIQAGHTLTVCFDVPLEEWGTTIEVTTDFKDGPDDVTYHELDQAHPCFTYLVPEDATGVLLHDTNRWALDVAVVVTPA